jgi:hypothetical protein
VGSSPYRIPSRLHDYTHNPSLPIVEKVLGDVMNQQAIPLDIEFTGILVAQTVLPAIEIPSGYLPVKYAHITILANELGKDRKAWKTANLKSLPAFPSVTFSAPYLASNGTKESVVCDCIEQDAIREWVIQSIAILGIPVTLNPERVFHISVANRTGSQYDSVPDPWNHRS